MDLKNKRSYGTEGEKLAADYLVKIGYKLITSNFRVGKLGEIDIIARDGEYLCFIEVKARSSTFFGMPSQAVNRRKQETIIKLASIFTSRNNQWDCSIRFDIVEVLMEQKNGQTNVKSINLIKNAFQGA